MEAESTIKCPKCGTDINVSEVLYHQLQDQIKKGFAQKEIDFEAEKESFKKEKEKFDEEVKIEVRKQLKTEKTTLEKSIRTQVEDEKSEELKILQEELKQKSDQVKEFNRTKAEIERLKREKDELKDLMELEKEKAISEKSQEIKTKARKEADEENYLKIKEKEKIIQDLTSKLDEAKRKAEQGSGQLQGEVQELEIEKMLLELYPFDIIEEIKKGQRGADIIQKVRTNQGIDCGKIYYESKRTKNFDNGWLKKLRDDNLTVKADVLILVTETMPENADNFLLKDGVWICSFSEVKGLSLVLRQSVLQVHSVAVTQHGKETKTEMLYNYLISQEFRGQFEAIIEGYKALHDNYHDERVKMQKIWKEREKQLEKIITNAVNVYGSFKGIAGSSIPDIKMLEDSQAAAQLIE